MCEEDRVCGVIAVLGITRVISEMNLGAFGDGMPLSKDLDIKYNQGKKRGFSSPPTCFPKCMSTGHIWERRM